MMRIKHRYIKSARDIGETINAQGKTIYVVGNAIMPITLSKIEYLLWRKISDYETLEDWHKAMKKIMENKTELSLEQIEAKFKMLQIITKWHFDNFEDKNLSNLNVTRNGMAHGLVNNRYLLSNYKAEKMYELSKEEYFTWCAATGSVMLIEVIELIMEGLNVSAEKSYELMIEHGYKFINRGLWTVEYVSFDEGDD